MVPTPEMSEAMRMVLAALYGVAAACHVGLAIVWEETAPKVLHWITAATLTAAALAFVFES